jgi:hypothetical protein
MSFLRSGTRLGPVLLAAGCARSPAFNVLGSYFPGWLACILLGALVAAGIRTILHQLQWEARIAALPIFYLSVALAIACGFWLLAFE